MSAAVITALAAWQPHPIAIAQWRKSVRCASANRSGWHAWMRTWRAEHARYAHTHGVSERRGAIERARTPMCAQRDAARVPVATQLDLSGLAAQVANSLWTSRRADTSGARAPDIVIFCHSSLDEHVSSTTAGRLRAALGAPCFAFSVSQQQGASVFTALQIATDLLTAEPDLSTILIVAAEKWHPPFSRWATPFLLQGDAAGALLIERARDSVHGLRVLDARTARTSSRAMSALRGAKPVARVWAAPLISLISQMLAHHAHLGCEINEVVGHRGSAFLTNAVCKYLGREALCAADEPHVHLGAAESIVRLAEHLHRAALPHHARLLLWGFGLGGYVGGALLEAHGAPHVILQNHA